MAELSLLGGALCLDFVNSVDPRHGDERADFIDSYDGLVAWAIHAGALTPAVGRRLRRAAAERPAEAREVLSRALALREASYVVFTGHGSTSARARALATVTAEVRAAFASAELQHRRGEYELVFRGNGALAETLWPVARSALDLLTSTDIRRVRECDGELCGWLFLDRSKAGRRRWCSMDSCGNRAKARTYRRRRAR